MASDDNKKLLERIKSLFKKLKESVTNAVLFSIYGNSVLSKLDDLEDRMLEAAENGEITQRSVDKLAETIGGISGILENLTREDVSKVRGEVDKFIEECKDSLSKEERGLFMAVENIYDLTQEVVKGDASYAGMTSDQFREAFEKGFELYDTGHFMEDEKSGYALGKLKSESGDVYFKIKMSETANSPYTFNTEPISEEEGKKLEAESRRIKPRPQEKKTDLLFRGFFSPRGLYTVDTLKASQAYKKMKEERPDIARSAELLYDCYDEVKKSEDGRVETYYDSQKNNFYIRDTVTREMLCYSTTANEVRVTFYADTDSIEKDKDNKDKNVGDLNNTRFISDKQRGITRYQLGFTDFGKSALFYRAESLDFLKSKNLNTDVLVRIVKDKSRGRSEAKGNATKKGWYNVSNDALPKINMLKEYLEQAQMRFGTDYEITCEVKKTRTGKSSVVYLTAENPKTGEAMSFSFSKAGEPLTINHRDDKNGKFTFMLDCTNGARGAESVKLLQGNSDFRTMMALFENSYNLYVDEQQRTASAEKGGVKLDKKGDADFTDGSAGKDMDYAFE